MTDNKRTILERFKERNKEPSENWQTYNDQLNTRLLDKPNAHISRIDLITLATDEYPLLECNLPNGNYFLVTTSHVYSYFRHYLFREKHENLIEFNTSTYFFKHPKFGNKTELYVLECKAQKLFFFEIDSGASGYYATQLLGVILDQNP